MKREKLTLKLTFCYHKYCNHKTTGKDIGCSLEIRNLKFALSNLGLAVVCNVEILPFQNIWSHVWFV